MLKLIYKFLISTMTEEINETCYAYSADVLCSEKPEYQKECETCGKKICYNCGSSFHWKHTFRCSPCRDLEIENKSGDWYENVESKIPIVKINDTKPESKGWCVII
jgi:hypothetical protein